MGIEHDDMLPDERELASGKPAATPAATVDDETEAAAAAAAASAGATEAADAADAAAAGEKKPDAEAEAPQTAPAAEPPVYRTLTRAELDTERNKLRADKDKAFADFDEGVIDRDAYLKITREADDAIEELTGQRTLLVANEQRVQAAQEAKIESLKAQAKADSTIDYETDPSAVDEFNAALELIERIPANKALSFDARVDKAHGMVLAQRGIVKAAAAPAPQPAAGQKLAAAAAPAAPTARNVPMTLTNMPPAGAAPVGDDVMTQFGGIDDPDAAEAMLESMPASRRTALLRSTMPSGSRH